MSTERWLDADDRPGRPVPHRVHLVGIGGVGMAGIARLLVLRGHDVSGSDLRDGRVIEELRALGARVTIGHDTAVVDDVDQVVVSTAVPRDNVEVAAAFEQGIPVALRARTLADAMVDDRAVLIAGTHGKTTTTAMTAVALQSAGVDPSFVIGGHLNETGANAHAGADPVTVAEADEADRSFLAYEPDVAVVTNLELDHVDEFADEAELVEAFHAFVDRRRPGGRVVVCIDDDGARALARDLVDELGEDLVTYGTSPDADVVVTVVGPRRARVAVGGGEVELSLAVPGEHNLRNACAALVVVDLLGHDVGAAAAGLATFGGTQRRFQRLGTVHGVTVVDDYAHHPTELTATIGAAREGSPGRVVVVVQPHRYSRTRVLGAALGEAAAAADVVVVTDVYAGPETPEAGVSGRVVAEAAEAMGTAEVHFEPHLGAVPELVAGLVRDGDLVLVTGAGDVTRVGPALLDRLRTSRG